MLTIHHKTSAALRTVLLGAIPLWLVACAEKAVAPEMPATPAITRVDAPPEWRPGDRWVFDWTSGTNTGTKTVEVLEVKEVNAVQFYVVRIGDLDHYYTLALEWSASVREGRVESRMVPPQPWFAWPLEVRKRWVHRGSYEEREKQQQQNDTFAVETAEPVEVPAGRFHALKVIREASRRDTDQYWYAPQVRWYVRWIGRRGNVEFEERLRAYYAAPRLIPKAPREGGPSAPQ